MSSPSEPSVLALDSVQFRYPGCDTIIRDLSFAVDNGEFIGLLGANGSGKSTVLKLAAGILHPDQGIVTLWGKSMRTYRTRDRAKLLSYFPQHLDVTVPFTVRELASMGLYPYDIPPHMTVEDAIGTVGLSGKSESYITNLSGGEKRRAFIAMTLVQGAGLVLLDEPLANLDIKYQVELLRLLHQLKRDRNISIIMALHDINLALQFERVILIKDGRLLGIGRPDEVLTAPRLREAFDVEIEISRHSSGESYVRYGNLSAR